MTTKLKKLTAQLSNTAALTVKSSKTQRISEGSVILNSKGELEFKPTLLNPSPDYKLLATGRYQKTIFSIGWSHLKIETHNNASPDMQSFAAGYLEGRLSAPEIAEFYANLVGIHSDEKQELSNVFDYYSKVEKAIRHKTSKEVLSKVNDSELEYWLTVAMVQAQTDGLLAGYSQVQSSSNLPEFNLSQIYFINADGEVPELMVSFKEQRGLFDTVRFSENKLRKGIRKYSKEYLRKFFGTGDPDKVWLNLMKHSHCSALVRPVLKDGRIEDVIVSHSTWDSYSEMHRIIKSYNFSYNLAESSKEYSVVFTSYPGTLTSTDDFYTVNSSMVVMETTLEILDKTIYKQLDASHHIPNYIRIFVANSIAKNGREWTEVFSKNNSGTYNSQWMVIDYNKLNESVFDRINGTKNSGLLHVLEQVPNLIESHDMTETMMKQGFWASFNRPFFSKTTEISGFEEMRRKYGDTYSYDSNERAVIFQSAVKNLNNVEDVQSFMRENKGVDMKVGGISIAPRFDLSEVDPHSSGATDCKIVDFNMIRNKEILAISGPSTSNNQKPFSWANFPSDPHFGLPTVYNFGWNIFNNEGYRPK